MNILSALLNKSIDDYHSYIHRYYNNTTMPYCSGIEITGSNIYSICPGKVIGVGRDATNLYEVTLLINSKQMIRYTHLMSVDVELNNVLSFNDPIGIAHQFVRLEYCTLEQTDSLDVVRVKDITMYKHNPIGLLRGTIKLDLIVDIDATNLPVENVQLDHHLATELTDNKGDED